MGALLNCLNAIREGRRTLSLNALINNDVIEIFNYVQARKPKMKNVYVFRKDMDTDCYIDIKATLKAQAGEYPQDDANLHTYLTRDNIMLEPSGKYFHVEASLAELLTKTIGTFIGDTCKTMADCLKHANIRGCSIVYKKKTYSAFELVNKFLADKGDILNRPAHISNNSIVLQPISGDTSQIWLPLVK